MLEENAATVTKLVFGRLKTKDRKIIVSLLVGEAEDQAQELAVDAARGRHARRQDSHMPVAAICVTIVADLVGSGALEDVIRVVGVAELALILPHLTSADEIMAKVTCTSISVCCAMRMLRISEIRSARDRRGGCPHS